MSNYQFTQYFSVKYWNRNSHHHSTYWQKTVHTNSMQKCSDRSMQVQLLAIEGNYDRPTESRTDGVIGKLHFQYWTYKLPFKYIYIIHNTCGIMIPHTEVVNRNCLNQIDVTCKCYRIWPCLFLAWRHNEDFAWFWINWVWMLIPFLLSRQAFCKTNCKKCHLQIFKALD